MTSTRALLAALTLIVGLVVATAATVRKVPYPESFRKWDHIKSMLIEKDHPLFEQFGGLHHVYANKKAYKGFMSGRFDNGSIIVFDLLEVKNADKSVVEDVRKLIGVMHKDTRRYAETGGWGFEAFKADSKERLVADNAKERWFGCHEAQKDKDFVFSTLRP